MNIDTLIAELRAGMEGTTPGYWELGEVEEDDQPSTDLGAVYAGAAGEVEIEVNTCDGSGAANARHIALASPQNIRALLDHIDRLTSERDAADDRLDAVRIDLLTEQSERKVAEAELARLRAPVMEGEVGDCLAKLNNRKVNEPDFGMRLRHEAADLLQRLAGQVAEVMEQIDLIRQSADWHKSQEVMALQNRIVEERQAAEARLREAVEVLWSAEKTMDDSELRNTPAHDDLLAFLATLKDHSNG